MSTTEDHQVKVVHNKTEDQTNEDADLFVRPLSRRNALMTIGIGLNALIGLIITVPVLGYVVGPVSERADQAGNVYHAVQDADGWHDG
jgi:hypothetical protein